MAIYHCSVKNISRSSGRSSVAAAAYRSGEDITNKRDGVRHDYTHKEGIVHSEIAVPDHAPEWAHDRAKLWNEVEKIEIAKDARTAREIEVAIPAELSKEQQIELTREYAQTFADQGMVADWSIHDKQDGNPHAHIMLTTRPFEANGEWGQKAKKEYILDRDGNKQMTANGNYKCRKIDTTNWNQAETLEKWREKWAEVGNRHLVRAGHEPALNNQSYERQGVDKVPTVHLGQEAVALERRGIKTELGDLNRQIQAQNKELGLVDRQVAALEKQKQVLERSLINGHGDRNPLDRDGNRDSREISADGRTYPAAEKIERGHSQGVRKQPSKGIGDDIRRELEAIDRKAGVGVESDGRENTKAREQQRGFGRGD